MSVSPSRVEWIRPDRLSGAVAGPLPAARVPHAERLVSWLVLSLLAICVGVAIYDLYLLVAGLR